MPAECLTTHSWPCWCWPTSKLHPIQLTQPPLPSTTTQVRVLVFGTFLTLACKPMFALLSTVYGVFGVSATIYWYFGAKLLDRMSKGIREAPTKAIMNELAKESGDSPDAAYGELLLLEWCFCLSHSFHVVLEVGTG